MSNCDKTTDYLKQDINKFDDKLNNNTKQINKLEQDIKIVNDNIKNNKKMIEDQNKIIQNLSKAMVETNKANVPKVGVDNPDDINPDEII
jgi:peptidoglycan hydrolase CwlO-like protein